MRLLSAVDTMFYRMESERTPMHIGALLTFRLPDSAGPDYVRTLYDAFCGLSFLPFPFDSQVTDGLLPEWNTVQPDPDYHVRLSALPYPGSEADLGKLVARLHANPLDMRRPLWEAHFIEGLSGGRFAMYFKAHHCAVDGMGAINTIKKWLSTEPDRYVPLSEAGPKAEVPDRNRVASVAYELWNRTTDGVTGSAELVKNLVGMIGGDNSHVGATLRTPRAPFNAALTPQRRLAVEVLELARLKGVAKATDTTVNDVTLAVCGSALRRYLDEQGELPEETLTASVPVGWERDEDTLNAAAGFVCPLATTESDPVERLKVINAGTTRGKKELLAMSPNALNSYTLMGLLPLTIGQKTGALTKIPPLFNLTVSNVVLTKEPLYLGGAQLELIAPVSFLCDGYGLNITLVGYTDKVILGFVGCRDTMPHLQRLAIYAREALDELEQAAA
ncbi:diacylglycerol O-acyltransferase [Mycobacterium sp. CBMA 234]|uniref:WS/DGAT/MGAT family O-acyltransferase n=1 Tax=Mycolicibacterium sp. CBMA 234 TaxID=1918495 RepID=UPI0012DC6E5C|nr:wax ester/triacylglycerol synthase family O-acyltransferase [Mycolicibacterium sp. CBMA 234]MUL66204.1 diacylglycerol O-acyltransferase [Mycolicibacterium sp. CBMA 234]